MTRTAAALVVALVAGRAQAAPLPQDSARPSLPQPGPASPDRVKLQSRLRSAHIERNLGWALAAVGAVLAAAGTITAVFGAYQDGYNVAGLVAGVALAAAGLAVAIPGIVLSLRGQNEIIEAEWRLRAIVPVGPVVPIVAPSSSRAGVLGDGFLVGARISF